MFAFFPTMSGDGPPSKRAYMGPPPSARAPETMHALSELEVRRELHMLRAEVEALRQHGEHTTAVHNAFAKETIGTMDNVLTRLSANDASWRDAKTKLEALEKGKIEHEHHFINADTMFKANKTELDEKLRLVADDLRKLNDPNFSVLSDLRDKMAFLEDRYVPEAIQALEDRCERNLRDLRERWIPKAMEQTALKTEHDLKELHDLFTKHATGAPLNVPTDTQLIETLIATGITERITGVTQLTEQMGLKIAETCDGRVAVVEVAVNKVYEGCKEKLAELQNELVKVMNHTVGLSEYMTSQVCPCRSGQCPMRLQSGHARTGSGGVHGPERPGHRSSSEGRSMASYSCRSASVERVVVPYDSWSVRRTRRELGRQSRWQWTAGRPGRRQARRDEDGDASRNPAEHQLPLQAV